MRSVVFLHQNISYILSFFCTFWAGMSVYSVVYDDKFFSQVVVTEC